MGNSVQYIKSVLHKEYDIPVTSNLLCEGRVLLDPLCLVDCDGIGPGRPNLIFVEVSSTCRHNSF